MRKRMNGSLALAIACCATVTGAPAFAEDRKYVGTWDGFSGVPIYSKLVLHADDRLTYCRVQSCRMLECSEMAYSGDLDGEFSFSDDLRSWHFEWTGDQQISGEMTTKAGDVSFAYFAPE